MRPPEFTGGNPLHRSARTSCRAASMRPPEFTGGNGRARILGRGPAPRFNEAAGIHRRKPDTRASAAPRWSQSFNEAAGIHRRKRVPVRAPMISGRRASMRPPEFTGGNFADPDIDHEALPSLQ